MSEEMIEEMRDSDDETQKYVDIFMGHVEKGKKQFLKDKAEGKDPNFYFVIRDAVWYTFRSSFLITALQYFIGSASAIGYTSFLIVLITYINAEESNVATGIGYLVIYATLMTSTAIF